LGARTFKGLKASLKASLAPVGSGNHYVDIFLDEQIACGSACISVHAGLGTRPHLLFEEAGGKTGWMLSRQSLSEESQVGQDYLAGMHLAGRYASRREFVARHVVQNILCGTSKRRFTTTTTLPGAEERRRELLDRGKGATPASLGNQKGFVGEAWAIPP